MARLATKTGVQPAIVPMVVRLANLVAPLRVVDTVTITSGLDGTHSARSLHYALRALDLRTKNFPSNDAKRGFLKLLQDHFGQDYDILLERLNGPNEHIHLEFDP